MFSSMSTLLLELWITGYLLEDHFLWCELKRQVPFTKLRGFPGSASDKESTFQAGDAAGSIPGSAKSPGGGNGNPLQYSCLGNPNGQRSLVGCSPWGHTEVDSTEHEHRHWSKISPLTEELDHNLKLSCVFLIKDRAPVYPAPASAQHPPRFGLAVVSRRIQYKVVHRVTSAILKTTTIILLLFFSWTLLGHSCSSLSPGQAPPSY